MKCRAKMINGDPVTFERHDRGLIREASTSSNEKDAYAIELLGEGFHVWSEVSRWAAEPIARSREVALRHHLECSGVDTATAERWDPDGLTPFGDFSRGVAYVGRWEPLFPPVSRTPTMDRLTHDLSFVERLSVKDIMYTGQEMERVCKMLESERAMNRELMRRLGAEGLCTEAMIEAGYHKWRELDLQNGRSCVTTWGLRQTIEQVWRAMEKARR